MQLLVSFQWIEGEAKDAEHQGHRRRGQEVVRQAEEAGVPEGRRLPEVPQGLRPDRGRHPQARPARHALEQDPRQGDEGQGQGHRRPDRGLLQQEQGALRPARAARPADRPDQGPGQGRAGQEGARERPVVRAVAKKYSIDQASKAQGGKLPAVAKGQQEKALDTRDLRRQEGQARRPGQDPVRLLRLRGHQDHAGHPADAGPGQGDDQADARVAEPAEGARHVRQVLPQALEGEDGLPRRLPHAGLQERAEGDADADGRPPPARRPRPAQPRQRRRSN